MRFFVQRGSGSKKICGGSASNPNAILVEGQIGHCGKKASNRNEERNTYSTSTTWIIKINS